MNSNIILKRDSDFSDYIKHINIKYFEHPEYKYFFINDYINLNNYYNNIGWDNDCFCIYNNDLKIVYILFAIDRTMHYVYNMSIIIEESHLNSGIGTIIINKFIDYCFKIKKYNKIKFEVVTKNIRALNIYKRIKGYREIGISKNDIITYDREVCDMLYCEIIKIK